MASKLLNYLWEVNYFAYKNIVSRFRLQILIANQYLQSASKLLTQLSMYTDFTFVSIISSLADSGQWDLKNCHGKVAGDNAAKLWHLLRALDESGSGKGLIDLRECAIFFNVQERAIRRWIKSGVELGFFRSYQYLTGNKIQLYYRSTIKLACRLKLQDLGAIVIAPIEALKDLKQSTAIATALELQRRSRYRAERKKGLGEKIDISKLFGQTFAHGTRAIARTLRYIYLTEEANIYGGSQRRAAWEQGRHESTNHRRLIALSPLNKRQVAQTKPEYLKEFFYKSHCELNLGRLFRIPDYPQLIFKAGCCLYNFPSWELARQKCLRAKVKKALQTMKNSLD